jgi:primosomal protein N'
MEDRPTTIEKRHFTCSSCNYSVQVYGEMYWDHGCHNYMATFMCKDCKILFENLISKIKLKEIEFKAYHDLADDLNCMYCGEDHAKVWNINEGRCPKCGGGMKFKVVGEIKVKFE